VPLLVVAPGVGRPGTAVAAPVSQVDLYPTLTELCGVTAPGNLQGQSLVPLLSDPGATGRGWALTQVMRGSGERRFAGYSLRTARWRYTEWGGGEKGRQLYDHDRDPQEMQNLAADPGHAGTVEDLSAQLRKAVAATLPDSGEPPALAPGLWAPNLTDP
jgi:iduronate 2-sulfatase